MRSWKTTLSGLVSSAAALVLALSQAGIVMPKWLPVVATFLMAGGMASLGIVGKDFNVSGLTAPPSKDVATK
jgi:hypothetical protein